MDQVASAMPYRLGLSDVYPMIKPGLWGLGKNSVEVKYPSLHILSGIHDMWHH